MTSDIFSFHPTLKFYTSIINSKSFLEQSCDYKASFVITPTQREINKRYEWGWAISIKNDEHNYTKLDKKVKIDKNQKEYLIDKQFSEDIRWITTNINAKEYIKKYTTKNALIDKNLLVNPEKQKNIQ